MKYDLKVSVKMNLQDGQTVKLIEVLYVPQTVKNLLSLSRLISKGATMGSTQDKIIIEKNRVGMYLDKSKGQNKSMMFYLETERYVPEVQEALTNFLGNKRKQVTKTIMA